MKSKTRAPQSARRRWRRRSRPSSLLVRLVQGVGIKGLGTLALLATNVLISRLAGPQVFGMIGLTVSTVVLVVLLLRLGFGTAGARYMAHALGGERYGDVRYTAMITFGVAIGGAILGALGVGLLATPLSQVMAADAIGETLKTFAIVMPAIGLLNWSTAVLKGLGRNRTQIFFEELYLNVATLCAVGAAYFLFVVDLRSTVLAYGAAYYSAAALACISAWRELEALPKAPGPETVTFRELLWHSLPLSLSGLAQRLMRRGDVIVIGTILGASAVGYYRAAYSLASALQQLTSPINDFALHLMAKEFGQKNTKNIFSHFKVSMISSLLLTLPASIVIIVMAPEIIVLIYGQEFSGSAGILRILAVGFSVFVATGPVTALLNVVNQNWIRFWLVLGVSVFNVVLSVVLSGPLGIVGVAISTTTGFIIFYAGMVAGVSRKIPGFAGHGRLGIGMVVISVLLAGGVSVLLEPWAGRLLASVLAAAAIAGLLLLTLIKEVRNRFGQGQHDEAARV